MIPSRHMRQVIGRYKQTLEQYRKERRASAEIDVLCHQSTL